MPKKSSRESSGSCGIPSRFLYGLRKAPYCRGEGKERELSGPAAAEHAESAL